MEPVGSTGRATGRMSGLVVALGLVATAACSNPGATGRADENAGDRVVVVRGPAILPIGPAAAMPRGQEEAMAPDAPGPDAPSFNAPALDMMTDAIAAVRDADPYRLSQVDLAAGDAGSDAAL